MWLKEESKDFYAAGFDVLVKRREINVLSMFEYHIFYVLYQFVTYSPTLPLISLQKIWLRTIKDQIYRYFSCRLHDKIVDMHLNYWPRN
jgi:hypothetical protein